MPSDTLSLQSQGVYLYDGGDDLATLGSLLSGDSDFMTIGGSASALRFLLPEGYDEHPITEVTLNLRVKRGSPYLSIETFTHKHKISVLASATQSIPTTGTGVSSATGTTAVKTIGEGTYSPALDYTITDSFTVIGIDLTAAFQEAQANGYLAGTAVVVLIQPVDFSESNYLDANGLTQTTPPTINFTWSSDFVILFDFDSVEITGDGKYLDCTVSSGTLMADMINLDNGLILSASGDTVTSAYHSGAGTGTLRFSLSRDINQGETVTLNHTLPTVEVSIIRNGTDRLMYFINKPVTNYSRYRGPIELDNTETTSFGDIRDFYILELENAETLSYGDNTPFIVNALLENSETLSFAVEPTSARSYSAELEDAYTASESEDLIAIYVYGNLRPSLFPSDLFGNKDATLFS